MFVMLPLLLDVSMFVVCVVVFDALGSRGESVTSLTKPNHPFNKVLRRLYFVKPC